jgi:hypothetical protein
MKRSESFDKLSENFPGKSQFIASAFGSFQVNLLFWWNDPRILLLCHSSSFDVNKNRNILVAGRLFLACLPVGRSLAPCLF